MHESWHSEILRVMDSPTFGERENLCVRLFHNKFQANASITQIEKDDELRLYTLVSDRYSSEGYAAFRNRIGFHIDFEEAMKEPQIGDNLHEMTTLILNWYRHIGTIVYQKEPVFFTQGGRTAGRAMALQFKEMMLDTLFHRANRERERVRKSLRRD